MDLQDEVIRIVQELLARTGETQAAFAKRAGLSPQTLSSILNRERVGSMRAVVVARIALAAELRPTAFGKLLYSCVENNSEKIPDCV